MKRFYFLIATIALILAGCGSIKTLNLPNYAAQISFYENSADYDPDGILLKCKLSDTAYLDGYKCIGWIHFFENGNIRQFKTAADIKTNNFVIPANSTIFYSERNHDQIRNIWLSKDVVIGGIGCKGGATITTDFHENGNLNACFLPIDQEIQGFPCLSSVFKPVYFYPDGKLKEFTLSADFNYRGIKFGKGSTIRLDEEGNLLIDPS